MSILKARQLRTQMTDAEWKIWSAIRDRKLGYKFRRQFPIGPYVLDFACLEARLAVEIDGGQHNENAKDAVRTKWLETKGWQELRFWNNEVLQQTEAVAEIILTTIRASLIQAVAPHPDN